MMDTQDYCEFIKNLADSSGKIINHYFEQVDKSLEVTIKADNTPVTQADREAESIIRKMIETRFPDHGIVGEEYGAHQENADLIWVIDPIDGTNTFTAGCPLFGTLICLMKNGEPWIGALNIPALNQFLIGTENGTFFNNKKVQVSQTTRMDESILLTTDPLAPSLFQKASNWDRLEARVKLIRTWGDCYGYSLVTRGLAEIMADPIMNSWDLLALIPIIRGAGGIITDWAGNDPVTGNSIVAANPILHEKTMHVLNG